MRPGERYLLFLVPYNGPIASGAYAVLGVVQGKFRIGTDARVSFEGSVQRLPEFATHRELEGRPLAEVLALLRTK